MVSNGVCRTSTTHRPDATKAQRAMVMLTDCNILPAVVEGLSGAAAHGANMTSKLVSFATMFTLLAADALVGNVAAADLPGDRLTPTIDVAAPRFWGTEDEDRGAQAARIELDDAHLNAAMSPWYRLAYVDGGTRLRVFEHSALSVGQARSDMAQSQDLAWRFATEIVGRADSSMSSQQRPGWAHVRTANETGYSAGLMFTLAYVDLLTPGALVGNLRVAGTGGIGSDGVVTPAFGIQIKLAAALLTRPDVIFTTSRPNAIEHVTIIESEHTRLPTPGRLVGEWLNVAGYARAGQDAAHHPGTMAVVVVHDIRQALAWLCGRVNNATTCAAAHTSATIAIGSPEQSGTTQ